MTSLSARKLQHLNGETQNSLHNHMYCSSISNASGTEAMGLVGLVGAYRGTHIAHGLCLKQTQQWRRGKEPPRTVMFVITNVSWRDGGWRWIEEESHTK